MADGGRMGLARHGVPVVDVALEAQRSRDELRGLLTRSLDGEGTGADRVDEEAERALLGAAMADPRLDGPLAVALRTVRAADFGSHVALAWRAVEALAAERTQPTLAAIATRLRDSGHTVSVYTLQDIARDYPITSNLEQHALLVARGGLARHLRAFGSRMVAAIDSGSRDPVQVRALAIEHLQGLHVPAAPHAGIHDDLDAVFSDLEERVSGARENFYPTGVEPIDDVIGGGLRDGMHLLISRPGIGKTTLALAMAAANARRGNAAAFFALEGSRVEAMQTLLCAEAGVSLERFTRAPRTLTPSDTAALNAAANTIASWPLYLFADDPKTGARAPRRVAEIASAVAKIPERVGSVYLDNIGEMLPTGRGFDDVAPRFEQIASDIREWSITGVRCPVVVLAHILRQLPNSRGLYTRPSPDGIYGGDATYKKAHGALILHREDKYPTKPENVDSATAAGVVDVLVPKMRGVRDMRFAQLLFDGDRQRFKAFGVSVRRAQSDEFGGHDVTEDAEGVL